MNEGLRQSVAKRTPAERQAIARAGGFARAANLSELERSQIARLRGLARRKYQTPERRSEIARKAVKARWLKRIKRKPPGTERERMNG